MADRRAFERLTEPEALRALYIDFEGEQDRAPVLLGVFRRGRGARPYVHHHVLGAAFAQLGDGGATTTLHDAIASIVRRADKGDRRIVSWTEHDLRVVRTLADEDPELVARFEARYANAHRVAERWRNKLHEGDKPAVGRLADYETLIDYDVPAEAVGGDVGETIRAVRKRRERGLDATDGQRERWRRLIEHNRHDCIGMRTICLRATRELDAEAGASPAVFVAGGGIRPASRLSDDVTQPSGGAGRVAAMAQVPLAAPDSSGATVVERHRDLPSVPRIRRRL